MDDMDYAAHRLVQCLRGAAKEGVDNSKPAQTTILTLQSIHPTRFNQGTMLPIPPSFIVTPPGVGFDARDVGKQFLFFKVNQGSNYVFISALGGV